MLVMKRKGLLEDESRRANGEYVLYEDGPPQPGGVVWCNCTDSGVGFDQLADKKAFLALVRDVLGTQVAEEDTSGHNQACSDHSRAWRV